MSYEDPDFNVRREAFLTNVTGIAGASMRKFLLFQKARLKAVHALVVTAGTNTAAGLDILVGTSSVGEVVCGTDTAGSVFHSAVLNAPVPQNGIIDVQGKANSATLVVSLSLEYDVLPDAIQS